MVDVEVVVVDVDVVGEYSTQAISERETRMSGGNVRRVEERGDGAGGKIVDPPGRGGRLGRG